MEQAAFIISVVAVLLSALALYLQFFHRRDSVVCSHIGYEVDFDQVAIQLAISNPGTRPILLKEARIVLSARTPDGTCYFFDPPTGTNAGPPRLIPRNEIVTAAMRISMDQEFLLKLANWNDQEVRLPSGEGWPFFVRAIFVTVSGKKLVLDEAAIYVQWEDAMVSSRLAPRTIWGLGSWKPDEVRSEADRVRAKHVTF